MSEVLLPRSRALPVPAPLLRRLAMLVLIGGGLAAGFVVTPAHLAGDAAVQAGPDLTRLLRAMALLKAMGAAALVAGVLWRLGAAITPAWFAAYAAACGASLAGAALIWDMAHVGTGALLLHGGLIAGAVLLWRDKAAVRQLAALVARRRANSA